MENGPLFWIGLLFLVLAVAIAVAPFVSWRRYQQRAARYARVGAHVLDVETERVGSRDHVNYIHHARLTYESEDGQRITQVIDFDDSIEAGAELWLLHDREDPWTVEPEREAQWLGKTVRRSVLGIVMALVGAYIMWAYAGILPGAGKVE